MTALAVVVCAVMVTACAGRPPLTSAASGSCPARGPLPDPRCTPGVTDPAVTQATLFTTVCSTGWSRARRPPLSWTSPVKRERMRAYGLAERSAADFELDHLVPLSLGGSPTSLGNLWPESGASPNRKDDVELAAVHAVCGNRIALAEAQHLMATDWTMLATRLNLP